MENVRKLRELKYYIEWLQILFDILAIMFEMFGFFFTSKC